MKRIILSAVMLLLLAFYGNAQLTVSLRAGVNVYDIVGTDANGAELQNKPVTGGHGGLTIDIPFNPNVYLQTGAILTQKGANLKSYDYLGTEYFGELRALYVEVPVNILIKPSNRKVFFGGGPFIAIGVGGEAELYDDKVKLDYKKEPSSSDLDEHPIIYKPIEAGIGILVGTRLSYRLSMQLNGELGLTTINTQMEQQSSDGKHRYRGGSLSFSYRLL